MGWGGASLSPKPSTLNPGPLSLFDVPGFRQDAGLRIFFYFSLRVVLKADKGILVFRVWAFRVIKAFRRALRLQERQGLRVLEVFR